MVVRSTCFAFRALITQARIWKRFGVEKLDKFTLFTHFLVRWNLKNLSKHAVLIFVAWPDILSEKNPYFGKPFFCKTKTDYVSKLRVQDFATGKNFSFNQCSKQESFAFFSGKLFYKSNRKLFSCVCISWCKHSRGWENSRQLCKPDTKSRVCIWLSRILPYPSRISYKVWWHGILELTVVLKVAQRFCFCWYLYYWICAWSSVARLLISVSKQARLMFSISEFP